MPKEKQRRTRVIGLPKNYKYKDWLHSALNIAEPAIDYFKFADTFGDSESTTNHHYADLLTKLSTGQSNRLTKISTTAKKLYNSRNSLDTDFGKQYKQYWEMRDTLNIQKALRNENQRTIIHLNELTNKEIRNLAEKTYNINESINEADEDYETNETEGEHEEEINDESSIAEKVIPQTANLASDDRVGKLKIIDLSSSAAVDILKTETSGDQVESILEATKIHPITMSTEAFGNKTIVAGLLEFSGGVNDRTPSSKNLIKHDGMLYRTVDIDMEIPNTPRKLLAYINKIPNILAWKQAVINHTLNLD
ncbi:hypothetical protein BCV72DRAFT_291160 [Rhizopus microsporus var. microsporus]|uniref:Uncharacterized protein n=1 Tax=Rhizopus microsporus var. microsporus TaxID=86635 RepID=A0A1X0R4D2_RHIZD|nr:hypothetical protein BCV72DRAFT_291160 [Rhizopus microsporus var. microsporus]